jgi:hypothetical protein
VVVRLARVVARGRSSDVDVAVIGRSSDAIRLAIERSSGGFASGLTRDHRRAAGACRRIARACTTIEWLTAIFDFDIQFQ